ncbi:type I MADS-domain transcription factor [Selaginella moellendorffii]|uniref:Type I MADS-domain transcription factor n=1 Tax=Selaginella moellendorffii TaxID=88036 RepID=D8RPL8_SELML|nr:type I MADS-domain transcription factor [Selaginella moellendorffii]
MIVPCIGKKKIPLKYIQDPETRKSCFRKRIFGITKKIWELHVLTRTILTVSAISPDTGKKYALDTIAGLNFETLPPQMKPFIQSLQGDTTHKLAEDRPKSQEPEELTLNKDSPPPLVSSPSLSSADGDFEDAIQAVQGEFVGSDIDGKQPQSRSLEGDEQTFTLDDAFLEELFSIPDNNIEFDESWLEQQPLLEFDTGKMLLEAP